MEREERKPPQSAKELLQRYKAGERDFGHANFLGANLIGAYLRGADLSGVDLSHAKLIDANLCDANLLSADLSYANLCGAKLSHAYLSYANLRGVDLHGADLSYANLCGAKLSHADLSYVNLRDAQLSYAQLSHAYLSDARLSSVDLSHADLSDARLSSADLSHANLSDARLSSADLSHANLSDAQLSGAQLSYANLRDAQLRNAQLSGADLSHADLRGANLRGVDLRGADLQGADLSEVDLGGATVKGATLKGTKLGGTHLLDIDLSPLCDASPPVVHLYPSTIDFRAIVKSLHSPNLKDLLQRTGMPEVFVEYMVDCALSLKTDVFKMLQSTFISYGHPDEPFARKLYEALHRNGVTTFFFPEHAVPGKKVGRTMREGVNQYDRVILVCSEASLIRTGVLAEIEHTLSREDRDGGASYLIPVVLDSYLFSGWKPTNADIALVLKERVAADFRGADKDDAKFNEGLRRLIAALKKADPPKASS